MKKHITLIIFLFGINISMFAQGKISGNLVNNNKPIEFATVTISNLLDSNKVLFYEASDSLGAFSFTNLNYGKYILKVKVVGFLPISKNATINADASVLNFKGINLIEDASELNKVTVTAQKKM